MTQKDEALKMAIERLKKSNLELDAIGNYSCQIYNDKAIIACKSALSEPETVTLPDGWVAVPVVETINAIENSVMHGWLNRLELRTKIRQAMLQSAPTLNKKG